MPLHALVAAAVITAVMLVPRVWADMAWERYKARLMMSDGCIIDTANGSVSHTEGQGFAILLAVANSGRPTFDKLWQWTDSTLRDKSNGLFYWCYNPVALGPIVDKNNASDGDTLIVWVLLRAQRRWQDKCYAIASDTITASPLGYTVVTFAGRQVMLPGMKGFNLNDHLNLNPSYFIFPAWRAFAERARLTAWRTLQIDRQVLLGQMGWGKSHLPSDWVVLWTDDKMLPAKEWPPRMSFDVIRIPLYLSWVDPQSALLVPRKAWMQGYPYLQAPAWISVSTSEVAPWYMVSDLLAVRDLTLGEPQEAPQIDDKDDCYSASLRQLV